MFLYDRSEKGAAMPFVIAIVAVVVLGVVYFAAVQKPAEDAAMEKKEEAMMKKEGDAMMEKTETGTGDVMMKKDDSAMMQKEDGAAGHMMQDGTMMKDDSAMMMKYAGVTLAGTSAPLLDFTKADYDAALKTDKLIALYFYADWCPVCKAEFPVMQGVFSELTTDKVIGFRVNYNDSSTDADEKNLAREFGVAYQHTKVFVKNGQRILKSPEGWTKDRYTTEITKALGQ